MTSPMNLPKDVVRAQRPGHRTSSFGTSSAREVIEQAKIYRERRLCTKESHIDQGLSGERLKKEIALERDRIEVIQSLLCQLAKVENTSLEIMTQKKDATPDLKRKLDEKLADRKRETEEYLRSCLH